MTTTTTSAPFAVHTDTGDMPSHLWLPDSGSGPGLVIVQEIFGVSEYVRRRASDLAGLGYTVLAPELYWRLTDTEIDESSPDALQQAMAVSGRVDWEAAVSDLLAALNQLRAQPQTRGRAGLIGFCFGGGLAFNVAALADPDVLVSYYGSALPSLLDLADQVSAPSLHHFGRADAFIGTDDQERIKEAVTRQSNTRFETYAGANHAFDNSTLPQLFNADASAAAWRSTTEFLHEQLPVDGFNGQ